MGERRRSGEGGERFAEDYLVRRGYAIVERNFSCRGGEVDLIAVHRGSVVFVEVRRRRVGSPVHPFESVDAAKRRRIVSAARYYATRNRLHDRPMRFDLVAVWDHGGRLECELLQNAFDLGDLPAPRRPW